MVCDKVEGAEMPTSQSGSKSRHIQFVGDDEQQERALALIEDDDRWVSEFLVRLASAVQNIGKE
jgi:trehalose-6-phosphatase